MNILNSICSPLSENGNQIVFKEIRPVTPFPFPWTADLFFDAFPESRMGIACPVDVHGLDDAGDAELIIVGYPVWFLAPAIPIHAFFQNESVKRYLQGKSLITVCGCRNMWSMAQKRMSDYIAEAGAKWIGSIVLQDRHHNLVSAVSTVRWLIGGRKERSTLFPEAGVAQRDIDNAAIFGQIISTAIKQGSLDNLQNALMKNGAIRYKPNMVFVENAGYRIFGIWSKIILKTTAGRPRRRHLLLKLFKYYLYIVLFAISPIGLLIFHLARPLLQKSIRRNKKKQCYELISCAQMKK
ncbi:MAG: hypothetical protein LBH04_08180 [Tannerellaceae bacterium]|nr:hypothetical protein [Tannerellaceae bacterium]